MATSTARDSEVGDRSSGTLLTMEAVQAMMPVSKMLQTGNNMMWTEEECVVENVEHQRLPVTMSKDVRR